MFLVVQKALARVLRFSALDSLKLGLNEGMSCPGMTVEKANGQSRLGIGSDVSFTFCTEVAVRAGAVRGAIGATKVLLVLLNNQLLWVRCFTIAEQAGLAGVMVVGDYNGTLVVVFLGIQGTSTAHVSLDERIDTITLVTDK